VLPFCCLRAVFFAEPPKLTAGGDRHLSIWIISAEGAGPNDIAQGEDLPARMEALRLSLAGTRVRLLNVEQPLAAKTASWFPEYTVPNFQAVASQRTAFTTLARFAAQNNVDIVLRVITWRESADLLRAARTAGPDALPDVMEIGTTWSGYLAASGRIRSRPDWQKGKGNWRDVLSVPACALPLITEVRLLFYWKRLPSAAPDSPPLTVNNAIGQISSILFVAALLPVKQLRSRLGIPLTFFTTMCSWSWRAEARLFCIRTCSARVCLSPARALSLCRSISPNIPRSRSVKGKFGSWSAFPRLPMKK
jgi:hypothetical protein